MNAIDTKLRRLLAAVLAATALVAIAAGCGDDDEDEPRSAEIVEVADLSAASDRLGQPIYWVGEQPRTDIELSESQAGRVYVRYLDEGAEPGVRSANHLTVVTYDVEDAAAALRRAVDTRPRAELARTDDGALMLIDPDAPRSVRIAYPRSDQQIEVYSPDVEQGLRLAKEGKVEPVP